MPDESQRGRERRGGVTMPYGELTLPPLSTGINALNGRFMKGISPPTKARNGASICPRGHNAAAQRDGRTSTSTAVPDIPTPDERRNRSWRSSTMDDGVCSPTSAKPPNGAKVHERMSDDAAATTKHATSTAKRIKSILTTATMASASTSRQIPSGWIK